MKKIIAILALTISAGAFAMNHSNHGNMNSNTHMNHSGHRMMTQIENLTPEQQAEYNDLHIQHRSDMQRIMLDIKEVNLKIQREMMAANPNQKNIDKLIDQKAGLQAQRQKDMLNFRIESKERFGIEMGGRNCNMMGKSNSHKMHRNNHSNRMA